MSELQMLLEQTRSRHSHLCPRQVLGVRMALAGVAALGLDLPRSDKRLLVIAETDGCFVDGLEVTAGVSPGHRTLRIEDYGKVAATFVDVKTGEAFRLAPRLDSRLRAVEYVPDEARRYDAQLHAYQQIPEHELFSIAAVTLTSPIEQIVSRPGVRVCCSICSEEIINEREIREQGMIYCRSCFQQGYYRSVEVVLPMTQVNSGVLPGV